MPTPVASALALASGERALTTERPVAQASKAKSIHQLGVAYGSSDELKHLLGGSINNNDGEVSALFFVLLWLLSNKWA